MSWYGTVRGRGRLPPQQPPGSNPLSWQLVTGHYTPSVALPVIVCPRPDSECSGIERHQLCPAGIPWAFPVRMVFGAWPFQYSIVSGPAGLAIGQTLGQANYGVMTWASPIAGTYSITVQILTQDYGRTTGGAPDPSGQYQITFTLVVAAVTDSRFLFLDAVNGNDANTGTFASPWKTLTPFAAATTSGKQTFFAPGTYNLNVLSSVLDLTNRSRTWVGYGASQPVISLGGTWSGTNCYIGFGAGQGTAGGASASNLTFFGSPSNWSTVNASGNFDLYHINHFGDRGVYYNCVFDSLNGQNVVAGGFSNWSAIAMFANSNANNYVVSCYNTIQNFSGLSSGGAHIWYSANLWIMEDDLVQGFSSPQNVQQAFISKGHCANGTMRHNLVPAQSSVNGITTCCYFQPQGADGSVGPTPNNNETCWNYGFLTPPGNNGLLGSANSYGSASFAPSQGWIHRNTFVGANYLAANGQSGVNLLLQNNVLCTEHGISNDALHYGAQPGLNLTDVGNVVDSFSNRNAVVDPVTGYLLSSYATAHGITIGTVGHQVL